MEQINLTPIKTVNLNDAVYAILRQHILNYNFEPGQRLDLETLENELQVSRTPLKHALTRLSVEGLVEIQPRRGTFVAPLDADRLDEAYKIRTSFELYVALCIFKYLQASDYAFFDDLEAQMDALVADENSNWQQILPHYIQVDTQLHERLIDCGGPARMLALFQQMNVHTHVQRIVQHYSETECRAMHFEHRQIFVALRNQSPEQLSAALLHHLEASRFRAVKSVAQHLNRA
ncbi:MAG: GntR family transcriptional regulator [Anaerolineae bacterium]|nr:GntR family transcriptional regulator [Anaerolineae bacterium]MDQ7033399.1 GntR family transcriptional regulator [Anaerolineae bacterium]